MKKKTKFDKFNHGLTPLNLAIAQPNKTEMVRHLIEKQNFDATQRDGLGRTSLEMAAIHAENIDLLLIYFSLLCLK